MKNTAILQIHEEHRAIGAVVHGLLHFAREAGRQAPSLPLLRTMLDYIEQFPQKLHHIKEEKYIFSALRARSPEAGALIENLNAQHADDLALTASLRAQLQDLEAGAEGAAERFCASVDRFADLQWRHMAEEERLLLPLAEKHLDDADWNRIAEAFGENGDPRFRGDNKSRFDEMFRLIVSTAPGPIGLG
ncbi:hemerythrin domain-containing protein [Thauera sinica]|uniref:Hemerythrin domain-containing protein n=1 Tax=Thauera sinica TaxID=2665146 RepID=A0ABW1APA7_9RHOO|nr:hemerythrin domain-containing protein [Thauera sp. K11]ATE62023.1 hypothetical protein CCZ27_20455 [Thauera sp. K11]